MTDPELTAERGHRSGVWASIQTERAALAADLAELTEEQWATPSLCAGLTVREVLAHLTAGASLNTARWFAGVIRCRFDFDKQVAVRLAGQLGSDPAETLERFGRVVPSTTKPPLPVIAMLGETLVHGEDIRRPLGIRRAYPVDVVTRVASGPGSGSCSVVDGGARMTSTTGEAVVVVPRRTGAPAEEIFRGCAWWRTRMASTLQRLGEPCAAR
ncbi:maleylpyruvate isomerase family mycothiol-dependent enzyme [Streptomyces tendae]|uniref:maleylpyruvate isomerase family mycothiol-dependent enzyme n=1 Tax=Streptomyces tendae TaxID=1932 RepID=UPI0037B54D87